MSTIKITRKRDLLYRNIIISVGEAKFALGSNSSYTIDLPEGEYIITAKLDWVSAHERIWISKKNETIVITQSIPNLYYLIGIVLVAILFALSYYGIIRMSIPYIVLCAYYIPLIGNLIFNKNRYFRFKFSNE